MSKNNLDQTIASFSPGTKKVVLEIVEKLERKVETTRSGELVLLEVASYRDDGYDELSLVGKLEECGILTIKGHDEFGHPLVLTFLDNVQNFKKALNKPSPVSESGIREIVDSEWENLLKDEIQLINKLLQICDEKTKWVVLNYPAYLAESESDQAGFDNVITLNGLQKNHGVFKGFKPPLESIKKRPQIIKARIDYKRLRQRAENLHDEVERWKGKVLGIKEQKKEFDVLYIWDRDRIGRKFYIQELILEELDEHSIELIDLHGTKAESPEDKILLGFKGLFAEFEKAKITERMRRGKVYKAKQGIYMNLQAPYGYTYVPKTKDSPGYLVINEEEAGVVRKIFNWIADEGLTRRKVIKRLHALKMYPRKKQRDYWGHGPICRLVRNETYIGKAFYNKSFAKVPDNPMKDERYKRIKKSSRGKKPREEWIPQSVPPILDEKLFHRVQAQLGRNLVFNPRKQKAPYLLTGLVYCDCGRRRTGEGVREHRYYRCTDAIHRYPLPRVCKASGVNAFHLDALVWRRVTDLISNPDLIRKQALRWMTKQKKQKELSNFDVINLKQLLKKLEFEEKRYIKAYGSGVLSLEQFKSRMAEIKDKRESMQAEVEKITVYRENQMFDLAAIENLDEKVKGVLSNFDLEKKRMFVREVLQSVSVGNENKVLVKGVIPVGKEVQNVSFWPSDRDSRLTQ